MDPLTVRIDPADPRGEAARILFDRHLSFAYASSPACSVHAQEPDALTGAGARFYLAWQGEKPVGMGAVKLLDPDHAEVKSMHVIEEARGAGIARSILDRLVLKAQRLGATRVSLETGSKPPFAAARALYQAAGFTLCPPFPPYVEDPESVFYTRTL